MGRCKMKRIVSFILAMAMILSIMVIPVAAEENPKLQLSVVTFSEDKANSKIVTGEARAEYEKDNLIALKIEFVNNATARYLTNCDFAIAFDSSAVAAYQFENSDRDTIGPAVSNLNGWSMDSKGSSDGLVKMSGAKSGGSSIAANETKTIGWLLFKVNEGAETGTYKFNFTGTDNQLEGSIEKDGATSPIELAFDQYECGISVKGVAPTLQSISITPDDGNTEAAYGEEKTYTLKALSTKDKDITDCVSWSVNFNGDHANGINITGNTLTIKADADILAWEGEYTVVATPITGKCSGEAKTGTFTILPQKITSLKLSLTNYGKGLSVSGATVTGPESVSIAQNSLQWFVNQTESVDSENFAAATAYSVKVPFSLNSNYKLEASEARLYVNASIETIEAQTVTGTIETHEVDGLTTYSVTFELPATGEKDTPELTPPDAITTTYGTTLTNSDLKNGSAKVGTETVTGTFSWPNNSQEVGDVNGSPYEYDVIFTPNNQNDYATATTKVTVTVNPASISEATVEIANQVYGESSPVPTVTLGGKTLVLGTDYEVTYSNNTDVGTATATITGKGNYTGEVTKNFQITKSIASCNITLQPADDSGYTYNGQEKKPTVTVTDGEKTLTSADYTVAYGENINAGTATVTVTGQGNYTGSVEKHFTIEPQHLSINTSKNTISDTFTYDGTAKEPNVPTLIAGINTEVTLTKDTDYTVEYDNNINAGSEAKIIFKPKTGSNYTFDEFTINFTIKKGTLANVETEKNVSVRYGDTTAHAVTDWGLPTDVEFTAEMGKVEDEQKILSNATLLGTQLTFRLKETTTANIGNTVTIPVAFSSQNYNDVTITLTITIVKKDDAGLNVLGTATKLTYGKEINLDYSVTNPGANGKLTATVTGEGDVTVDIEKKKLTATRVGEVRISFTYESDETIGTDSISFTVVPNEITVTADNQTREYGEANPTFTYKITSGRLELNDELNIEANTDANVTSPVGDNYPITLTQAEGANPNYAVTLELGTLTITKAPLTIESATVKSKEYDGNKTATVTAVEFSGLKNNETLTSSDYTATGEFKDANAGAEKEVGVTVTLNTTGTAANYELKSNTLDAKGTIEKRTTQVKFTKIKDATYTGKPYARENYTVNSENAIFKFYKADGNPLGEEISAPTDVGEYYINAIVEETANEKLSADSAKFAITQKDLSTEGITVEAIPDQTYTGEQLTPAVTIKYNGMTLTADKDYTVAYENCTNVGVATAKITGKGNYEGTTTKTFNITAKPVTNAQVIVNDTGLVYDKTAKQPTVIVKIGDTEVPPADYDVAYSNNVNAGTATATVTFKGNYTGTATGTFPIAPKTVGLTWEGSEFFYDKTEKTVTATAADVETGDTVTVTVKGGKQTEIGTYIATAAKLDNPNYKLPETGLSHPFEIKNAIASISVTSPATVSTTVDGLTIKLVGTMSEGTTPTLKINGVEMTPVNGKITVSGIEYTVDDSNVVKTPANVALTEDTPAVAPKQDATPETKAAANAISDEATKSEGLAAAAAEAVTNEAASKASGSGTIKAETKLEIQVESYVPASSATDNKATLTLEITPKVTYTYTDKDNEQKTETKTISNSDIKAPVTISVKLPEGMPTTNLFVKHLLKNGGVEYIQVTVDSNNVATWQQSSFSTAILMADDSTATITLVKDNGDQITMTLNRASVGTALPKDGTKTNWKFEGIGGSYSTITEELFEKLAKITGTVTATSVSGSSSDSDSKPSKPGNSSSGLLLPGLGDDQLLFRDVGKYDYYYNAVKWALKKDITSGTGRYTFSPDVACTRAQTVTFLWRAAGCPRPVSTVNPFTDVYYGDYFYQAVLWAVENGITMGTSATTFSPDATVTRAQVVTFLWRANGQPAAWNSGFTDVSADAYYAKAVAWAVQNSITTGTGFGVFSPDAACTRAQIVTFLYRYLG